MPGHPIPHVYLSSAAADNEDGFVQKLGERLGQELRIQMGEPASVVLGLGDDSRRNVANAATQNQKIKLQGFDFFIPAPLT